MVFVSTTRYIDAEINLRCIKVGEEVASKSFPVGKEVLYDISSIFLWEKSIESRYRWFKFYLKYTPGGGCRGESVLISTNG